MMYSRTKFEIGIPTYNRADLLIQALKIYKIKYPNTRIWIVDNGNQKLLDDYISENNTDNIILIKSPKNLGVAASWNLLCKNIWKNAEHALILNDDIVYVETEKEISELCDKYLLCKNTMDWSVFLIHSELFSSIGEFDESFYPAYYEDNDYEYRMKLGGLRVVSTLKMNPIIYRKSKSLEQDRSIIDLSRKNRQLYIKKWGGLPKREKFTKPYNK